VKKKIRTTKWELNRAAQAGREALDLLNGHKQDLEPRLDPGTIEGLQNDIPALEALKSGRPAKVQQVRGLTGSKADQARQGAGWIGAIREAVKRRAAGQGIRTAVGVGKSISHTQETSVAAAIEAILALSKEQPQALRACGVLDSDLATGQALLAALGTAHNIQHDGFVGSKNVTDQRNATHARVEEAVEAIATAGHLQYLETDPALAKRFANLLPTRANVKPANAKEGNPKDPSPKAPA
jgi:hypothetical protein